jgi:hypothetical protein
MPKIDLKTTQKELCQPSSQRIAIVEVPAFQFLMIDGEGDPNTEPAYAQAVEALFVASYSTKFAAKKAGTDYAVMPLEGLWWSDDPATFVAGDKSKWKWTMMVRQPDFVDGAVILASICEARRKKELPALDRLRLETFNEGRCAQILFVGPFSEEGPIIQCVHEFIQARGQLAGKHHEIYLTDIRRADPSKWRTIIRQPMA